MRCAYAPYNKCMTSPIISIRSVTKRFPGVVALADVSLDVQAGELHAICGENGAGKSTLMKILSGVIAGFEGEILLGGRPIRFQGTRDAEAAGISIIHQELNLVEQLSAAANIFLGREIRGWLGLRDDPPVQLAPHRVGQRAEDVVHSLRDTSVSVIHVLTCTVSSFRSESPMALTTGGRHG